MFLHPREIESLVARVLAEDVGRGDLTSECLIPADRKAELRFVAREACIVCGIGVVEEVFAVYARDMAHGDRRILCSEMVEDGHMAGPGEVLLKVSGNAQAILTAERSALNLLQRMSAVASYTRQFVAAIEGTGAVMLDTRKTMPGLRMLDKYAVRMGGGRNHRLRLDDGVLIKDNHIAICGGVAQAVQQAKAMTPALTRIEVECDTLEQVSEALAAGADMLLLDNMTPEQLREAVLRVDGRIPLEASGNVTLQTVRAIAETGVDYISAGALTHSAPNIDIGLDVVIGD